MRKVLIAGAVVFLLIVVAIFALPSNASSKAVALEWHSRVACTTNATGHCTQVYEHPLAVVPVVQVTSEGLTAIVHTYQVTATSFRVRVMQTTTTPWANRSVTLAVSAFAPSVVPSPSPSITVSPTPTVSPSQTTVSPTPTTPDPTIEPTTDPPVTADYPTAATTGVPSGTTLTAVSGNVIVTVPRTVIDGKKISGNVDIRAADVVIKNSEIAGIVVNDNTSNHYAFTIEDSTVGPASGCSSWGNGAIGTKNYTAKRIHLRGFGDGFRIAGGNVLIQDSYVKLCTTNPDAHSDGIQAYGAAGGQNIVIDHNVIDQRNVLDGTATSPIFIPVGPNQGNDNITVTVTNNVLAGGGFTLRVEGPGPFSAPSISNNKIVDGTWAYGPTDVTCSKIITWKGNIVAKYNFETGKITEQVRTLDDVC